MDLVNRLVRPDSTFTPSKPSLNPTFTMWSLIQNPLQSRRPPSFCCAQEGPSQCCHIEPPRGRRRPIPS
ncbi:hypothetical protein LB505_013080 [Fusarium chuoi]|nr:hypothetical protein LB505_013080 [Fusarium chuoi]